MDEPHVQLPVRWRFRDAHRARRLLHCHFAPRPRRAIPTATLVHKRKPNVGGCDTNNTRIARHHRDHLLTASQTTARCMSAQIRLLQCSMSREDCLRDWDFHLGQIVCYIKYDVRIGFFPDVASYSSANGTSRSRLAPTPERIVRRSVNTISRDLGAVFIFVCYPDHESPSRCSIP